MIKSLNGDKFMKNKSIVALGTVLLASALINNPIEAEASFIPKENIWSWESDYITNGISLQSVREENGRYTSGYMFTTEKCNLYTQEQIDNNDFSQPLTIPENTALYVYALEEFPSSNIEIVPVIYNDKEYYIYNGRMNSQVSDILSFTLSLDNNAQSFALDTLSVTVCSTSFNTPVYDNDLGEGTPINYLNNCVLSPTYCMTYNSKTGYLGYQIVKENTEDVNQKYGIVYINARDIILDFSPSNYSFGINSTINESIYGDTLLTEEFQKSLLSNAPSMTLYEWMEKTLTASLIEKSTQGRYVNYFTFDFLNTPEALLNTSSTGKVINQYFINHTPELLSFNLASDSIDLFKPEELNVDTYSKNNTISALKTNEYKAINDKFTELNPSTSFEEFEELER